MQLAVYFMKFASVSAYTTKENNRFLFKLSKFLQEPFFGTSIDRQYFTGSVN